VIAEWPYAADLLAPGQRRIVTYGVHDAAAEIVCSKTPLEAELLTASALLSPWRPPTTCHWPARHRRPACPPQKPLTGPAPVWYKSSASGWRASAMF